MVLVTKEQLEFKELLAGQKDRIQEQSKKQEDQLNQVCCLYAHLPCIPHLSCVPDLPCLHTIR